MNFLSSSTVPGTTNLQMSVFFANLRLEELWANYKVSWGQILAAGNYSVNYDVMKCVQIYLVEKIKY